MASLEKRGKQGLYRLVFVHGGKKHSVSLDTADDKAARTARKRLEANLHDVEHNGLDIRLNRNGIVQLKRICNTRSAGGRICNSWRLSARVGRGKCGCLSWGACNGGGGREGAASLVAANSQAPGV